MFPSSLLIGSSNQECQKCSVPGKSQPLETQWAVTLVFDDNTGECLVELEGKQAQEYLRMCDFSRREVAEKEVRVEH